MRRAWTRRIRRSRIRNGPHDGESDPYLRRRRVPTRRPPGVPTPSLGPVSHPESLFDGLRACTRPPGTENCKKPFGLFFTTRRRYKVEIDARTHSEVRLGHNFKTNPAMAARAPLETIKRRRAAKQLSNLEATQTSDVVNESQRRHPEVQGASQGPVFHPEHFFGRSQSPSRAPEGRKSPRTTRRDFFATRGSGASSRSLFFF